VYLKSLLSSFRFDSCRYRHVPMDEEDVGHNMHSYLEAKRQKLRQQFAAEKSPVDLQQLVQRHAGAGAADSPTSASEPPATSNILRKVCIYINGLTKPAFPEMRALVLVSLRRLCFWWS
jgi:hypothetical protein